MTLGKMIENYRTEHGLSQRQFALMCGLSNGYISMLERGFNPQTKLPIVPTLPQIKKLAKGLGITVSEVFSCVDDIQIELTPINKNGCFVSKFHERLKLLRTSRGLSQSDLAKFLGISKSSVNMYERGEREPSLETLEAIGDFFNVDMDYLHGKSDIENRYQIDPELSTINDSVYATIWHRRLLEMKKASGLTTKDVFEKSNVPVGTLNKLFAGQTLDPKLETIKAVVYSMGYSLNDLFPEDFDKQIYAFKNEEQEYVKKYRRLDDYGKETVNLITDRELARVEAATDAPPASEHSLDAYLKRHSISKDEIPHNFERLSVSRVAEDVTLPTSEDDSDKK